MAAQPNWTDAEDKKLWKAVKGAKSLAEMVACACAALPSRKLDLNGIGVRLRRLGHPKPSEIVVANRGRVAEGEKGSELARFALVAKQGNYTLEELCDRLDKSPKKVRLLLSEAQRAGYRLAMADGKIGYEPPKPAEGEQRVVAEAGEEHIFAVTSDIHIGSKYCREDFFVDFVHSAYAQGVRKIFGPGDNLDGVYRHSRWNQTHHGFDEQADRFVKILPKLPGLSYWMIAGNHDETFETESGLDVCKSTVDRFRAAGRDDFHMVGARGGYLRYAPKGGRGVLVELWHPMGGGSYAVSYKLQRHVEEYGIGAKPDFVFAGHWHQQCYVVRRGVHCFLSGTFHGGGGSFGKALGGTQAIGGWIVRFKQTKQGAVREVAPTWRGYYEREEVREMGLG